MNNTNIIYIDFTPLDCENLVSLYGCFSGCTNLKKIDFGNFNYIHTNSSNYIGECFKNCTALTEIVCNQYIKNFITTNATTMSLTQEQLNKITFTLK